MPPDAAWRAEVVAWIDGRRELGMTRKGACRLAGVSTRSCNRWRATLNRYGVGVLAAREAEEAGSGQVDGANAEAKEPLESGE